MDLTETLNINKDRVISSESILNEIQNSKNLKYILPLGLKNFDKSILNRGFHPNKKYLIFGANKSGKTQICYQICVQAFKLFSKELGYSKKENIKFTYYLDTENTFRPERIKEIAIAMNLDYFKIFESINVASIMSNYALLLKLKEIEEQEQLQNVRVLIIDSINKYYRSEQGNKEISYYNTRTTFLKILKIIDDLTEKFNLISIITAQVAPNFIDDAIIRDIPVGNQYLNHFFSEYLYLSLKDDKNYIHLLNSQLLPENNVPFKITPNGIEDLKI